LNVFFQIRFIATLVYAVVIQFVTRKKREKERILESIFTTRRIKKKMKTTYTHTHTHTHTHTQNCSLAKQILPPNILLRKIIFMQLRK